MTRIIVLGLLFLFSTHAFAAEIINRSGGPSWPSGVGQILLPKGYDSWKSWTGYDVDIMTVWISKADTWAQFETASGNDDTYFTGSMSYLPKTTPIVLSYPMLPESLSNRGCSNPGVWDRFAAGDFDEHYTAFARAFRARVEGFGRNPADHVIRLGWEMNGDWYAWSICNKQTQFKASWERAVRIIRKEIPGIKIDFSPARPYVGFTGGKNYNGGPGCDLECFLPAEWSYDVISRSTHDSHPFVVDESSWQIHLDPPANDRRIGLLDIVRAAKAHGKKIALTEWAPQMTDCNDSFSRSPKPELFIRKVYDFLSSNAELVAWDTHFSVGCVALYNRESTEAAREYRAKWGGGMGGDSQPRVAPLPPELSAN
jgi:hypothetical protein